MGFSPGYLGKKAGDGGSPSPETSSRVVELGKSASEPTTTHCFMGKQWRATTESPVGVTPRRTPKGVKWEKWEKGEA